MTGREWHWPGYNYLGPGTKLRERQASSNPKYRNPVNRLDALALKHDLAYEAASRSGGSKKDILAAKHKADREMVSAIKNLKNKTVPERIIRGVIGSKEKLGL